MDIDWNKVENDIAAFGFEIYSLEECTIGHCLGSGSVMEVFEGQCNINTVTKNVAFKRHMKFKSSTLEQKEVNKILHDFRHEITLMRSLKYPTNIAQIYGVTFETKKPVLIVELGNQTLSRYLLDKAQSGTPATWHEKIKLCDDVSRSIRCLHNAGIIHGDIKGDDVLIFIESTGITIAKLSGFGHSSAMNSSNGNKISMAPETRGIEELKAWEEKSAQDIFNFGLVMYQIANDGKTACDDPEGNLKVDSTNRHTEVLLANLRRDTPEVFRIIVTSTTKYMPTDRASLDIVEKIIYDFLNVSSSQVKTVNTPFPYLGSYIESPQSQLSPPSALEIIPDSLPDSKKFHPDELKNNSKTAELNEIKRSYEEAKNTLETFIILNGVLEVNQLPISPSLKQSIFHEYQQLAEVGDVFAQFMSGLCWINGFGTEKNEFKAIEYFTKASEAGNGQAQNILGICYDEGRGVIKDMSKAIQLYTMAAEAGNIKAQCNLGICYEIGAGVAVNYVKAVEWYRKAAEADYAPAQNGLGILYELGYGVTKDLSKAYELYQKGADAGNREAQNNLGILYEKGYGVIMDLTKAFELYTNAAEAGNLDAQCNLGLCYEYGKGVTKDITQAVKWYEKAAETGNARAQCNLGYCYERGRGVTKDVAKALELYEKAAENGHPRAQNNLGFLYEKGIGITKDYKKAFEWYQKGAQGGDCWAQSNLGYCYQYGNGVSKNEFKAVELYRKSAEAGNTSGMNNLAYCYKKGIGITRDYGKAIELYTKAAKVGSEMAELNIESLKNKMV